MEASDSMELCYSMEAPDYKGEANYGHVIISTSYYEQCGGRWMVSMDQVDCVCQAERKEQVEQIWTATEGVIRGWHWVTWVNIKEFEWWNIFSYSYILITSIDMYACIYLLSQKISVSYTHSITFIYILIYLCIIGFDLTKIYAFIHSLLSLFPFCHLNMHTFIQFINEVCVLP